MSHSSGAVRFKDGTVKYSEYDGTSDIMCSRLYDTAEEMQEHWRKDNNADCECDEAEEVRIMSTYGGSFSWNGKACRKHMAITDGRQPYGQERAPWEEQTKEEWKAEQESLAKTGGEPEWNPFKS